MIAPSSRPPVSIEGYLERIAFCNPENHYTVAKLRADKINNPVTVVGYMPGAAPGDSLKIMGNWETHAR